MRFLATILAIPMVWCVTPASNAWAAQDVVTAAVHRELDRAVSPQPGNEHLLRLSALRALRDQALKPLLISLAETGPPSIQKPIEISESCVYATNPESSWSPPRGCILFRDFFAGFFEFSRFHIHIYFLKHGSKMG